MAKEQPTENFYVLRAMKIGAREPHFPHLAADGAAIHHTATEGAGQFFKGKAIAVVDPALEGSRPVMGFDQLNLDVVVTRERVIFFCQEYDRGDPLGFGLGAGALLAGALWLISRNRAKRRSSDRVLVGHIPFDLSRTMTVDDNLLILGSISPIGGRSLATLVEFDSGSTAESVMSCLAEAGFRHLNPSV